MAYCESVYMKLTAWMVLITFSMLILEPTAVAAQTLHDEYEQTLATSQADSQTQPLAQLATTLETLETQLTALVTDASSTIRKRTSLDLTRLQTQLTQLDRDILADFAAVQVQLANKSLPASILDRHTQAVAHYQQAMQTLQASLNTLNTSTDDTSLRSAANTALTQLNTLRQGRAQQPFNPSELPYQTLQPPADNLPKTTQKAFRQAGLHNNPLAKVAALGNFRYDTLAGADDPAYLAATPEVVLSQAIHDKAKALEYNPINIYNFVRNNVHWLPTWGAMQDAELTLSSLRGNAADISTLVIALLRASGIPARYAHGTIDVRVERFMNWVGDFADANAAAIHAASGGIPVQPVLVNGQMTHYRIEHIWVEAAVDFMPSRGARNLAADSWAPLDASFKQYEYLQGIDVEAIAPVDYPALLTEFNDSGTQDTTAGWFTGFDDSVIQQTQTTRQAAVEQYIADNFTDPTVGDIVGGQRIISQVRPMLAASLPNRLKVIGARYGELPDALRHRVSFDFNTATVLGGGSQVSYPLAALNNRKVTLSFKPASADDEAALASLLPNGEITDISQLPQQIPAYLIQMVAELKVAGVTVLQGTPVSLGADQLFNFTLHLPSFGSRVHPSPVVAGSYLSVAVVGGSFSRVILESLQQELETHDAAWQAGDFTDFTREHFLGNLFYVGTLSYFAQYYGMTTLQARAAGVAFQLMPSVGTYGSVPEVDYLFGIPRTVSPGGIEMDMDRVSSVFTVESGEQDQRFGFTFAAGLLSSLLEHVVPEQMFVRAGEEGEAISAVKALYLANAQQIPVYHITQANAASVIPRLQLNALTISEIETAIAVGKEVITHESPVSVPGWSGAGYIIFDPVTGDGAYKIGGGLNGSFLEKLTAVLAGFFASIFLSLGVVFFAGSFAPMLFKQMDDMAVALAGVIAFALGLGISSGFSDTKYKEEFKAGSQIGINIVSLVGILLLWSSGMLSIGFAILGLILVIWTLYDLIMDTIQLLSYAIPIQMYARYRLRGSGSEARENLLAV